MINQIMDEKKRDHIMLKATHHLLSLHEGWLGTPFTEVLKPIGEFFDADRITLCLLEPHEQTFFVVSEWCHLGIKPLDVISFPIHGDQSVSWIHQLEKNPLILNPFQSNDIEQTWLSSLKGHPITSMMLVPLSHEEHFIGYLSFENHRRPHDFSIILSDSFDTFINVISLKISLHLLKQERNLQSEQTTTKQSHQYAFVANVSHEIRTPLNGIHNALYLLQTTDLTKDQKEFIDMGQRSADHLSTMVDRILDLEALESGKMEIQLRSFNLEDELVRLIQMHQRSIAQKGLDTHFEFDYRIQFDVIMDDRKIRQILSHLLSNAIKFTEKGSITLGCKLDEEHQNIHFYVSDTGIGVSKDSISELFDAFYLPDVSDRREYQGLGIGLTIVKQLTQLLGGTLHVESELQKGSTFQVTLPYQIGQKQSFDAIAPYDFLLIHDQKPSHFKPLIESMGVHTFDEKHIETHKVDVMIFEVNVKSTEVINTYKDMYGKHDVLMFALHHLDQRRFKKMDGMIEWPISRMMLLQRLMRTIHELHKTVASEYTKKISGHALIVDDNRLNRIALESILNNMGMTSMLAESGQRAIEAVKEHTFDVILMDIQMPHMDGLEATRRIRSLGTPSSHAPIIAVTANAYFNDYDMLKQSQMNDVIYKPIKMDSLSQVLRKHLNGMNTLHIPDELIVFDRQDFLKRFEGSYDIAKEVIMTFQQEYPKDLEKIRVAIQEKNAEHIVSTAHYFKGSCAYLSGKRLVWILNLMMEHARKNTLDEMHDLFDLLIKEADELMQAIDVMKVMGS